MDWQPSLLGGGEPGFDKTFGRVRRIELDRDSWIEHATGWVTGSTALFQAVREATTWHAERREMYDKVVDVPRLTARFPEDGGDHPLIAAMAAALSARYGFELHRISAALYRDGNDSVAWHRDRGVRELREGCVAIVSLGGPRRFMVRPLGGGQSQAISFGWGDLLVMGGASNRTWEHAVPKTSHAEPRIALMFRHSTA